MLLKFSKIKLRRLEKCKMPKRKLDINVRNPFALKDAVSGPNKKKEVKSANLNAEADTSANPQLSSTYEEPNFNLFAGTELGVLKGKLELLS